MKRTHLLLLSLIAGANTAFAAATETQWYGQAGAALIYQNPKSGSTSSKGSSVESVNTKLGVRGVEPLADGLQSIYELQLEYAPFVRDGQEDLTAKIGLVGLKGDAGALALGRLQKPSYALLRSRFDKMNTLGSAAFETIGGAAEIDEALSWSQREGDYRLGFASQISSVPGQSDDADIAMQWPLAQSGYVSMSAMQRNGENEYGVSMSVEQESRWSIGYLKQDSSTEVFLGQLELRLGVQQTATFLYEQQKLNNFKQSDISLQVQRQLGEQTGIYTELQSGDHRDAIAIGLIKAF